MVTCKEASPDFVHAIRAQNEVLSVTNLSKRYPGFVLSGVSFSVPKGTIVGLVGSNGAGKTTTIKSILGLIGPDHGGIEVLGTRVFPERSNAETLRSISRVGAAFDSVAFPGNVTVNDSRSIMRIACERFDLEKFDQYCAVFGLNAKKKVKELSRGMGMKLSLAAALSSSPELLILDEPTAGLDPMAREELLEILSGFVSEDTGILMSSHITSDLEKIADRIVCIDNGRLIFDESKYHILHETKLAICQDDDLHRIEKHYGKSNPIRYVSHGAGFMVLVNEPEEFESNYPNIRLGHTTIDDYMILMLRGEML